MKDLIAKTLMVIAFLPLMYVPLSFVWFILEGIFT
ncbi:hypothetical protein VP409E501_P0073 [Vibrio phage 409E50-1]|nr:hypothetical protein VP521E561_P0073 [Vibrio phage 521E56-1]CAH9013085.1 hypothetical protein VP384E501_P0073 [Vibrio phage 384E50-1]CAH9013120.1 hypothetical protein VP409E501_P0073 [Vibrio phage 409E50-1]CAH9013150.1 hypothetical protein VP402E501_P0073 [Vibrio phage 402E50-1]CAH9013845.1 hypothetical protein VP405E501_P0073 [Vibrio phage 405E50-1]CAH9013898.1 hypothetical protein VP413E501_P0073 [Vibrio phage 413E50-1]